MRILRTDTDQNGPTFIDAFYTKQKKKEEKVIKVRKKSNKTDFLYLYIVQCKFTCTFKAVYNVSVLYNYKDITRKATATMVASVWQLF